MLACINKNSVEYQSLKQKAGISEDILEAICRGFLEDYGRFPNLDELPLANSESNLKEVLHINSQNSTSVQEILNYTGKETISEANSVINNEFSDLETEIIQLNKEAIVEITHRPNEYNFENANSVEIDENIDNIQVFGNAILKLSSLYGIKFNEITNSDLASNEWIGKIPDSHAVNAFVYNGEIYINTDMASVDAPLHEILHLFVGSIRFTNPRLYEELINMSESFPSYTSLAEEYNGRSRNDINEEIFVTEVAKLFTGRPSNLSNLSGNIIHEITYNVKRVLDTILMGQDSVKTISDGRLFTMSLREIAQQVNSKSFVNKFHGTMNVEGSELHRILNNRKKDLINDGQLKEICE